uniref:Uncharacterized protein n=1 Tax=Arundo donax TaxID=35708 RepID=A0A0A9F8Q1_ARUDO
MAFGYNRRRLSVEWSTWSSIFKYQKSGPIISIMFTLEGLNMLLDYN